MDLARYVAGSCSSLDLERKALEEIDPEFVGAHCTTDEEVIAAAKGADGILNDSESPGDGGGFSEGFPRQSMGWAILKP